MVWWIPVAMAAAGALEGDEKRKRNEKKLQAQAEIARWSPWTGLAPHDVSTEDSALHGAMQGGVAGMGMSQNMKGDGDNKSADLTDNAGAPNKPYSRPANTSNMSVTPPPTAQPAQPAQPAQNLTFDTQAKPNMPQETLSPEDAALRRKFPWAQMSTGTSNQSRMG